MNNPTIKSHTKEAFFFGPEGQARYAMAHRPVSDTDRAIIFCNPFADEIQRSYRPLYNFAESLAEEGYLAFRFEYRGCGDSQGNHVKTDLHSRLEDIAAAVACVKERYGITRVGLLGLRLGASLAALYAAGEESAKALILWEPILDGRKHLYDGLRSNITSQTFVFREVLHNRDQLVENMRGGEPLWIDGYEIDEPLFAQICELDLATAANDIKSPTLYVNILPVRQSLNAQIEASVKSIVETIGDASHEVINEHSFWVNKRIYIPSSPQLNELTLNWLREKF